MLAMVSALSQHHLSFLNHFFSPITLPQVLTASPLFLPGSQSLCAVFLTQKFYTSQKQSMGDLGIPDVPCPLSVIFWIPVIGFSLSSLVVCLRRCLLSCRCCCPVFREIWASHTYTVSAPLHCWKRPFFSLACSRLFSLENFHNRMCTSRSTEPSLRGNLWKTNPCAVCMPMS